MENEKYNNLFSSETKFAKFMNVLAGLLWTGILWLICSLPLFTMGTASAAAHDTIRTAVIKPRGSVTGTFFTSFKTNLKLTLPFNIAFVLIMGLLIFDCIYLFGYGTEFSQMLSYILYVFVVLFLALSIYIFTLCSYYEDTRFEILKLAVYMNFRHLLISMGFIALIIVSGLLLYLMPWSLIVVPGLFWYAETLLQGLVMKKYFEEEEEEEEEWHVDLPEESLTEMDDDNPKGKAKKKLYKNKRTVGEEEPSEDLEENGQGETKKRERLEVEEKTADMSEIAARMLLETDPDRIIRKKD